MDRASYHCSTETRACINHLRMQVVINAPYSYAATPSEIWFAHFKKGNFNPNGIKTSKR